MKPEELKKLLDEIRTRNGGNVKTADRYLSALNSCFTGDGGLCPVTQFNAKSQDDWERCVKEAQSVPVYCGEDSEILSSDIAWDSVGSKGLEEAEQIDTSKFLLTRRCVMSTSSKDRDGDILESSGCEFKAKSLLWMHNRIMPVGSVFVPEVTKSNVSCGLGIADVGDGLGQDLAKLVEVNGLQISHGFDPLKYEPLKGGRYRFLKYETNEVSLVTVPANFEAIIIANEKGQLESAAVKMFANRLSDKAKSTKNATVTVGATIKEDGSVESSPIGASVKYRPEVPDILPNSWEHVSHQLRSDVKRYKKEHGFNDWVYVIATYPDHVVLYREKDVPGSWEDCYYKVSWSLVAGVAALSGEPQEIELSVSVDVIEKAKQLQKHYDKETQPCGCHSKSADEVPFMEQFSAWMPTASHEELGELKKKIELAETLRSDFKAVQRNQEALQALNSLH